MIKTNFQVEFLTVFQKTDNSFQTYRVTVSCYFSFLAMFGLVPGGSVHIKIIHQFLRFIVIGFRLTVKCGFYIFRREEMLMNIILPVFYKLAVHQISFGVIVIDEHQINGSRGVFPISIVVSIFLHVELALTAFGKPPTLAGFQLISYFLNTFHVLGRRFRILVRSTDFLYFIPVCMQVTFHKTDSHFGRIFMQFIICLIFRNYRIFTA